jgi:hypothetical protein
LANLAASFNKNIPMNYSITNTLPTDKNIAIVLLGEDVPYSGLLNEQELAYLKSMRANHTEQWIEINQYTRAGFLCYVIERPKGSAYAH